MARRVYTFDGDGWFPRVSPDAETVCFGGGGSPAAPPTVSAHHIPGGGHWTIGEGRNARFIQPPIVAWTHELNDSESQLFHTDLRTNRTIDVGAQLRMVAGNDFDAHDGHWASCIAGGRLVLDNYPIVVRGMRGCSMDGPWLLSVRDDREFVVRHVPSNVETNVLPLPLSANAWRINARGDISYGYWGPAMVLTRAGNYLPVDVTVTPWRRESVPVVLDAEGQTWIWTFTEAPNGKVGVIGRPFGSLACIICDGFLGGSLDARYRPLSGTFLIAGCSDRGRLEVWEAGIADIRESLVAWGGTTPVPPDPAPPEDRMKLPPDAKNIYAQFVAAIPPTFVSMSGSDAKDNAAREWCVKLAQQLAFSLPNQGWGTKRADNGRPISKDTIARRQGSQILVWDLFVGLGTSNTLINPDPDSLDVSNQVFVEVTPTNYLGGDPEPGPGPDPEPPAPGFETEVVSLLTEILLVLKQIRDD